MKIGNRNRRNRQRASADNTWSQLITVALIFLLFIPRCVGCRSPIDPLIEKFYGGKLDPDGSMNTDAATKELREEMIRRDSQR
jgi:hypothetical protein